MALNQGIIRIWETIKRFPVPILCSLSFCFLLILGIYKSNSHMHYAHLAILFSVCFWLISLKLYAESKRYSIGQYYLIGLTPSVFIAWYFYALKSAIYSFCFLGLGLFLLMFIAPFISRNSKNGEIWWFQYRLFIQICLSTLVTLILLILSFFATHSLELLFDFKFSGRVHVYILSILTTFISPIIAMSGIPTRYTEDSKDYPNFVQLILSYIFIPSLLIYSVVLYAYAAKILISWTLPKGIIGYLVTIFGTLGIATYVVSDPFKKTSRIFHFFNKNFFIIFIVPIALLATAIAVRIYEFGFTEARCFILVFLIWFVLCSVFYFLRKQNYLLQFFA